MRHMDEGMLQAWLDRPRSGLSREEEAAVEAHLAECPECAARLEALQGSDALAGALLADAGEVEEEIPDFQGVVARARELDGGATPPGQVGEGSPEEDAVEAPVPAGTARIHRWRVRLGWAASILVALGAGWMSNELMNREPAEPAELFAPALPEAGATPREVEMDADPQEAGEDAAGVTLADQAPEPTVDVEAPSQPEVGVPLLEDEVPGAMAPVPGPPEGRAESPVAAADSTLVAEIPAPVRRDSVRLANAPPAGRVAMDSIRLMNRVDEAERAAESALRARGAAVSEEAARRTALASDQVAVAGRVTDASSGRPLESAQVFIPSLNVGGLTNQEGRFRILVPSRADSMQEELTLRVEIIGYSGATRSLALARGDTTLDDVQLSQTALALDQLVVTGTTGEQRRRPETESRADVTTLPAAVAPSPIPVPPGEEAGWVEASVAEAEAHLGFPIRTVEGLEVERLEVATVSGSPVVRVVQALEGGDGRLTLLQAPVAVRFADVVEGDAIATTWAGGQVYVIGRAPLPQEEVQALLGRLR